MAQSPNNAASELPPFSGILEGDYQQLQGSWVVTANEIKKRNMPQMAGAVFNFSKNEHWISGDKGHDYFALDEKTSPKSIDFYDKTNPVIKGIYKIEGSKLTLCTAAPGQPRPVDFKTSIFTGTILTTAERQKEDP
ncbi:MAG: TIGR03067 domain-containing protein [Prosthecobacter sp.]